MAGRTAFVGRTLPDDDTMFPRACNSGCLRYKDRWSHGDTHVTIEVPRDRAGQVWMATKRDLWLLIYLLR
jgi:hypothetical protein